MRVFCKSDLRISCLQKAIGETHRNKQFSSHKHVGIFHRLKFQGYLCESGIEIFAT